MPPIPERHRGIPSTSSPALKWAAAIAAAALVAVLGLVFLIGDGVEPAQGPAQQPAPVVGYAPDDDGPEIEVKIKHEGPRVVAPRSPVVRRTGRPVPSPRMTLSAGTAGRSSVGRTTVRKSP